MAAVEFKRMVDVNYSSICELLPSNPRTAENLCAFARDYIQRMKEDFKDQPDELAMFSQRLQEAAARMLEVFPAIRTEGGPRGELERIRASPEVVDHSFLRRKFDELPGLVDAEEEGVVDEGLVSKWCGFLSEVGGKLSGSERCKYELLRQLSNFNLGLINRCELGVVVADMIGEYGDLMQEFGSLLPPLDHDDEDGRKRKRIAEAHQQKQRKQRKNSPCRQITEDGDDDKNYAYILEYRLAEAIRYASQILHGTSDTSEWSAYFRTNKAYFERIIKEMYDDQGPEVLAMTEEDLANTLPAVIRRLQQKARERM